MKQKIVKLGLVTVGQSPRTDMTTDLRAVLIRNAELMEQGALDPYSYDEVLQLFAPEEGDALLVSRMKDGRQVCFAEKFIRPLVQACISSLEGKGCSAVLLMCTGKFEGLEHRVPLIKPQEILPGIVKALCGKKQPLGLIIPSDAQQDQIREWWGSGPMLKIAAASPYGDADELTRAASVLKEEKVRMVFMDCMGYSLKMKERVRSILGKGSTVLLPRTFIARVVNEIIS